MKLLIREIRKARGLTLEALGERAGVSRSHLNDFELGRRVPNVRRLSAIARALEVEPEDLIEKSSSGSSLSLVIEAFPKLSERRQQIVLDLIESLSAENTREKESKE